MTDAEYKHDWYLRHEEEAKERSRLHYRNNIQDKKIKAHEYYIKNRERLLASTQNYRDNNREKVRASDHKTYEKHKERRTVEQIAYSRLHPHINLEASRRYRANNPEKRKMTALASSHLRRAQKLATQFEKIDYDAIKSTGICGICNLPICGKYHFDHIIPLSKGGTHTQNNLQLAHPRCNLRKSAKLDYVHIDAKLKEAV